MTQYGADRKIVPVEIVPDRPLIKIPAPTAGMAQSGRFRVVLARGISIEVESGFDAAELRRLIEALAGVAMCGSLSRPA